MNPNSEIAWMKDPDLNQIPEYKLLFLQNMFFESKNYHGKELVPFFLSLAAKSKNQNISFSEAEIETIVNTMKKYATAEDIVKMNQVMKMVKNRQPY